MLAIWYTTWWKQIGTTCLQIHKSVLGYQNNTGFDLSSPRCGSWRCSAAWRTPRGPLRRFRAFCCTTQGYTEPGEIVCQVVFVLQWSVNWTNLNGHQFKSYLHTIVTIFAQIFTKLKWNSPPHKRRRYPAPPCTTPEKIVIHSNSIIIIDIDPTPFTHNQVPLPFLCPPSGNGNCQGWQKPPGCSCRSPGRSPHTFPRSQSRSELNEIK